MELKPLAYSVERIAYRKAFTFVELIVAATMISILFVGLGTHLRGGITVWERATQTTEALQRKRVALDRLERDLAHAFIYDAEKAHYGTTAGELPQPEFTGQSLAFFTLESQGSGASPTVRFVTYEWVAQEEQLGLARTSRSIGQARANPSAAPTQEILLTGVESPAFKYAYLPKDPAVAGVEWYDDWKPDPIKEYLPRLIRVSGRVGSRPLYRMMAIFSGSLVEYP